MEPAIEIMLPGTAIAAIAAASFVFFWGRSVRMSSTSQELLDLFEEGVRLEEGARRPRVEIVLAGSLGATQSTARACEKWRRRGLASQVSRADSMRPERSRWAHF